MVADVNIVLSFMKAASASSDHRKVLRVEVSERSCNPAIVANSRYKELYCHFSTGKHDVK